MHRPHLSHYATAVFVAGAALFVSTVDSGALSVLDRLGFRIGFVLLITGGLTILGIRVRRPTADDLERARQAGFDEGRADAFAVQPQLIDLQSARTALTERRAAQQLSQ